MPSGETISFETQPNVSNTWVARGILQGSSYRHLPFVTDVSTIVDVGANVGATSVYFSHVYPDATIHAVEPAAAPRELLRRNVEGRRIVVHPIALASSNAEAVPLYAGEDGASILGSIYRRETNTDVAESITLRHAGEWAEEHGIDVIDILKVDVEGAEVEVLSALEHLLPTVKVVYVEYDSRQARRDVFRLLERDHEVLVGRLFLDQGECMFLRHDLLDHEDVRPTLLEMLRGTMLGEGSE